MNRVLSDELSVDILDGLIFLLRLRGEHQIGFISL